MNRRQFLLSVGFATALCVLSAFFGALRAPRAQPITLPPFAVSKSKVHNRSLETQSGIGFTFTRERTELGGMYIDRQAGLPSWGRWSQTRPIETRAGWPFRCAIASWPRRRTAEPSDLIGHVRSLWESGIPFGAEEWGIPGRSSRRFPMRPIWTGVLGNLVFYTCIVLVIAYSLGAVRFRLRRRRGLCPRCAYPISSPRCPECGVHIEDRIAG